MVTFYASGAIEEKWTTKDVMPNRIVAGVGMSFGSLVSMSVVVVAALVLARRGIAADTYQQAAGVLSETFGRWGFWLFCASLFIGCIGAALELSLDVSYLVAQTFGWNWGEDMRPSQEARFPLIYTGALVLAMIPAVIGVDPLKFTMFSMAATVVALPLLVGPLLVVMNDKQYLKAHTNGWISNVAVTVIIALAFVLAVLAIPVQILGK
jgi:Mn2+/Fe2+ NRAMP family transporter